MAEAMEHLTDNWPHYVNAVLQLAIFLHQTVPGADYIQGDVPPLIQLGLGLASVGTGGYINHSIPLGKAGRFFGKDETMREHWTPEVSVANIVYALSLINVIFAILGLSGVKGVRNANNSSRARRGGKARRSRRSRSKSRRRRRN